MDQISVFQTLKIAEPILHVYCILHPHRAILKNQDYHETQS